VVPVVPALPVVELSTQALLAQCWVDPQACPQLPQLALLVVVSTQLDPHMVWPLAQPQLPALQTVPEGQVVPQPPQFSPSLPLVTTQAVPHRVCPPAQVVVQALLLQTSPD